MKQSNYCRQIYSLDFGAAGNRTASHRSASYAYQSNNRLTNTATASFGYDNNGNMTQKTDSSGTWVYEWDAENRLKKATRPDGQNVVYKYDAFGRRIERVPSSGVSTKFTHDGQDVLLDQNSDATTIKYLNGLGIDNKLRQTTNSGTASYFLSDHLGSTNALTNSLGVITSQTNYDGFGNQTATLSTRYGYTGRERDDFTGLMHYRARQYSPELGRFISEDPIGFKGGDVNLYGYVGNSPLLNFDPLGLDIDAVYSQSKKSFDIIENWGGWGIYDWFYGPKRRESFKVFSGDCDCSQSVVGGPIPKGFYLIDKDHDFKGDEPWKRISYRLYASQTDSFDGPFKPQKDVYEPNSGKYITRDNFYIHPGSRSLGCITFQKDSNLPDGAPWSSDYEKFDGILQGTSPYYYKGDKFGGRLQVID